MEDLRKTAGRRGGVVFLILRAASDPLLPIELFVEKEDQEVDIHFSSIK